MQIRRHATRKTLNKTLCLPWNIILTFKQNGKLWIQNAVKDATVNSPTLINILCAFVFGANKYFVLWKKQNDMNNRLALTLTLMLWRCLCLAFMNVTGGDPKCICISMYGVIWLERAHRALSNLALGASACVQRVTFLLPPWFCIFPLFYLRFGWTSLEAEVLEWMAGMQRVRFMCMLQGVRNTMWSRSGLVTCPSWTFVNLRACISNKNINLNFAFLKIAFMTRRKGCVTYLLFRVAHIRTDWIGQRNGLIKVTHLSPKILQNLLICMNFATRRKFHSWHTHPSMHLVHGRQSTVAVNVEATTTSHPLKWNLPALPPNHLQKHSTLQLRNEKNLSIKAFHLLAKI